MMIVRGLEEIMGTEREVDWGNGKSYRLLVESDGLGFAAMETLVRAGTESLLEYRNHLEACYCIAGEGEVEDMEGNIYRIKPGVIYALNHHDKHYLRADDSADMKLVSIFNPPLKGNEHHNLNGEGSSSY